ncbi:MAG: hypothetical protein HQK49_16070 [Oligoflexia bacterium]|nr:hypothetical protein [Oligoflexia bacterium]
MKESYKALKDTGIFIDEVSNESINFDSETHLLEIEVDVCTIEDDEFETETEIKRVKIIFHYTIWFDYIPSDLYNREKLFINDQYFPTIYEVSHSKMISKLHDAEKARYQPQSKLKHYVVPCADGVWNIVARDFKIVR